MLLFREQFPCRTKKYINDALILYITNRAPVQVDLSQTWLSRAGHAAFPAGSVHGLALLLDTYSKAPFHATFLLIKSTSKRIPPRQSSARTKQTGSRFPVSS